MPLYSFQCQTCDNATFDESRPFSASDETATCPVCGGTNTRRVYDFSSRAQIPKLMARIAAEERTERSHPAAPAGSKVLAPQIEEGTAGAGTAD